jgi:hypothetical protein
MEFEKYIQSLSVADKTKRNIIRTIENYIDVFDVIDPNAVIKNIQNDDIYINISRKKNIAISMIHYFRFAGFDDSKLQKHLKKINDIQNKSYIQRNKILKKELPDYKTLWAFNLENYKQGKYRAFVVNYLLINYFVRLLDLDLIISKDTKNIDADKNYLILRKTSIIYYRNYFKTVKKFGPQKHIIKSKRMINSLNELIGDCKQVQLLTTHKNLNGEIKKYTYNKLNESDYYKIMISSKNKLKDYKRLTQLRGSSLETACISYDLNL